jgi:hypothetical protein
MGGALSETCVARRRAAKRVFPDEEGSRELIAAPKSHAK